MPRKNFYFSSPEYFPKWEKRENHILETKIRKTQKQEKRIRFKNTLRKVTRTRIDAEKFYQKILLPANCIHLFL